MDQQKRYQIFVSSTFADLEEERGKVMETILNYDCFPAGMEMFPAMDEAIFEYIKRIIDDSDYYMLIIGGRYGSEDDDGVSWTEKEYDYAVSKGIPVIAFDHKDFTELSAKKTDQDDKKRKKLIAFKKKVAKGRLIKKWTNKDDLALAVSTSLKRVLEFQPRIGWVRANSLQNDGAQKEIDILQREITKQLAEVKRLEAELEKKGSENITLESDYRVALQNVEYYKETNKALMAKLTKQSSESIKEIQLLPKTETLNVEGVSFKMVHVEGGTFMMGAKKNDSEASINEKPAHEVTLSDYWIGETQVTQALWQAVMGKNPSRFKDDLNCPVESVSWEDCQTFIRRLNKLTGKKFRLPTEAQWEFAARGGNIGKDHHYRYAGSNDIFDVAWFLENSDSKTHPIGEREPNELGLYDMSGNVCEWCYDYYDYYDKSSKENPMGPSNGSYRVYRGGVWNSDASYCRVTNRNSSSQASASYHIGLRLAL